MRTVLILALLAAGCSKAVEHEPASQIEAVASVTVEQLAQGLAAGTYQAVDANGDQTRQRMGVIPGAVLLRDYASTDGLPADKARGLVFYCANTACSASHEAARAAIAAGYRDVKVLPDGIAGWVKAGKRTASI
jgi:rhodanese-related sulfurtransferase